MLSLTICTFVESVWARIPYRGECQKPVIMSMVQGQISFSPSTPPVVLRKDTLARTHSIVPLADPDPAAWTLRYVESTRKMSD